MLKMSQVDDIRKMSDCGYRIGEIAEKVGVDRKTVRKYLEKDDFSPRPPVKVSHSSILDPYKPRIQEWLHEDRGCWHKQQHTAKRILARLQNEEGFKGSYSTVQRYVKAIRHQERGDRYTELIWEPGTAQVDFGEADFMVRGERKRLKYLTVSFPYSNDGYVQIFGGETSECVCQGLQDIFAYIGGVPRLLIFDNATGVGRRVGDHVHEADLFRRFRMHYGFQVRFCNPYAGHEKGNVERKVGYIRSNLFVPVPQLEDLASYNRSLLGAHAGKADERHYKKGVRIADLFQKDKECLRPLPRKPFDVCRYEWLKADGYGKISLDGKHHYSSKPENGRKQVLVGIHATHVDILEDDGTLLVSHERRFGPERTDSSDYATTLRTLVDKPGTWENSGLREQTTDILKEYLDHLNNHDRRRQLSTMRDLTDRYGLETAMAAMERGIRGDRLSACDAGVLAERMATWGLDTQPDAGPSLAVYDEAFLKGGELH